MKTSLQWLNDYLSDPIDADLAERLLTDQGFPIESREKVGAGDEMLDVEVTSNRGDCLSHVGVARELAAGSGRTLRLPDASLPAQAGPAIESILKVSNEASALCPVYTARVIRGVKVGPSPAWLVAKLEAVGLRSVNNVVDVTNFVLFESGQPLHAFDLAKLAGGKIVVRQANKGETFEAIDGSKHTLRQGMLVIADASAPSAIAGVMGGKHSEVVETTTDIVIEAAIFAPMVVRQTSRALKLMSDSSHRFERGVDPQGVDRASRRAAKLIIDLAGGQLAQGVIVAGSLPASVAPVSLRVARCNDLLGLNLSASAIVGILEKLGLSPVLNETTQTIACTIPSHRLDLYREVDLIEEVARLAGLDGIPVNDRIEIQARAPQTPIVARRVLDQVLTAAGYYETVNFSFLSPAQGKPFLPAGHQALMIDDDRRKAEPMLRPSTLPSLLVCRKANQDVGNAGIRLYEVASVWSQANGQTIEKRRLGVLVDAPSAQETLRQLRGVLDELALQLTGSASLTVEADASDPAGSVYQASARLIYQGQAIGTLGVINKKTQDVFGLQTSVVLAELDIEPLIRAYPSRGVVGQLARYPGTWRDLSVIVEESLPWSAIEAQIHQAQLPMLEAMEFLTTYRGKPIPAGRKSVSFRMAFRDPNATLRHEQVEPQVAALVDRLKTHLNAELRS